MPEFCHLHCHTTYSLLDGTARIDTLIQKARKLKMKGIAITDHGNLYGVPEFYIAAKKAGLRPVIGCEFYLTPSGMEDKKDRTRYHQLLLAKNETGYRNLVKLSSLSFTEGFYYKPRVDFATLAKYSEGLIATTCCIQGEVPQKILKSSEEDARKAFQKYLNLFNENYYIEVQKQPLEEQEKVNEVLLRWSKEFDVKVIATNDVHYVEAEDFHAQEILLCLQSNTKLSDPNRWTFGEGQLYLKSTEEMLHAFSGEPMAASWLETTAEIADQCSVELKLGNLLMPHFTIPDSFKGDVDRYLSHLVFDRAKERYSEIGPEIEQRLNHELGIIREMGYAGYFLIVQDFTTAARSMNVDVGPGRGSAAGSAVAYCLGITNIDPLKYGLLFERFLNPERVSMPDIDIDFDDLGRGKVIDYVVKKYGRDNVCQIITYGTMGARSSIRDVARVLEISQRTTKRLVGLIPEYPNATLANAFKDNVELKAELNQAKELNQKINRTPNFDQSKLPLTEKDRLKIPDLFKYAQILEGGVRHTGVHAAGVIIAPGPVSDYIPTAIAKNKDEQVLTTQFDGNWVEKFGLLKMDFLGLSTLTVLRETIRLIKDNRRVEVDLDNLPLDDPKTFTLFQHGQTAGIFQFESQGMRKWLIKLRPTQLDDLIAMNALYRPGPMDLIPDYIARKHGESPIEYPHEILQPVLKSTYGLPVYQEQVMQMAQVMAGYTLGEADILRRAMGKKKKKDMADQRVLFIKRAQEKKIRSSTAERTFDMMEKFAGYGFNKCLAGSTNITHALTGESTTLETLFARGPEDFMIHALSPDGRFIARPVENVFFNGYKPVYTVFTGSGRSLTATATHKFLTPHGWQRLETLQPGDQLITPKPEFYLNRSVPTVASTGNTALLVSPVIDLNHSDTEVAWDTILTIRSAGRTHTFDLTVAENHNYLANGLVVHNSHSAAYSLIAYQTAYMKANYTPEFMAAVLTNTTGDIRKFASMLGETRRLGLKLLLPSVNHSQGHFTVENKQIRFGLASIKGLGKTTIESIIASRKKHGPQKTLFSMMTSVSSGDLGEKTLKSLIYAGAMDELDGHRAQLINAIDTAIRYANAQEKMTLTGQTSLFGTEGTTVLPPPPLPECDPVSKASALKKEGELIGAFISGHPLDDWAIEVRAINPSVLAGPDTPNGNGHRKSRRTYCGVITGAKRRKTNQNRFILEATFEDKTGQGEILCLADSVRNPQEEHLYHRTLADDILKPGEVVRVSGEVETDGGGIKVLVRNINDIIPLQQIRQHIQRLIITLNPLETSLKSINRFAETCKNNRGNCEIWFKVKHNKRTSMLKSRDVTIAPTSVFMKAVHEFFGPNQVDAMIKPTFKMSKPRILFVCTHNSARSQMAEGLLRRLYGDHYDIGSAGTEPSEVSPYAVVVMREISIDISRQTCDSIEAFAEPAPDYVFTLCDSAADSCPHVFAKRKVIHHSFKDPRAVLGTDEEILAVFRLVRDDIREWVLHEFNPTK